MRDKVMSQFDQWMEQARTSSELFSGYEYPGVALTVCELLKRQTSSLSDEELNEWLSVDAGKAVLVQCKEYEKDVALERAKEYLASIDMPVNLYKYIPLKDCMRSKEYLSNLYIVQHPETAKDYNSFRYENTGMSEAELNEEFAKWVEQPKQEQSTPAPEPAKRDDYELFRESRQDYILEMKERLANTVLQYDEYLFRAGRRAGEEKLRMVYKDDVEYCAWRMMDSGEWDDILNEWYAMWIEPTEMEECKEIYLSTFYGEDRDQQKDAVRLQQCIDDLPPSSKQELEAKHPPDNYKLYYAMSVAMNMRRDDKDVPKEDVNVDEVFDAYNEFIGVCATAEVPFELGKFNYRNKIGSRQTDDIKNSLAGYVWGEYGVELDNPRQLTDFMLKNPQEIPNIKRAIEQHTNRLQHYQKQLEVEHDRYVEARYDEQVARDQERPSSRATYNDYDDRRSRSSYNFSRNSSDNRYSRNNSDNRYNRNDNRLFSNNRNTQNGGEMPTLQMARNVILGMAAIILLLVAIVMHAWYLLIPALSILAAVIVWHITKKMYLAAIIAIVPTLLMCVVMSYL